MKFSTENRNQKYWQDWLPRVDLFLSSGLLPLLLTPFMVKHSYMITFSLKLIGSGLQTCKLIEDIFSNYSILNNF